jgi:hypothetical protein
MIEPALAAVDRASDARDPRAFADSFEMLSERCNACRHAEQAPFVVVAIPADRRSSVRSSAPPALAP